ncbi:MAG: hypothetical protein AABX75_00430 [Nanoarchaeota archaeon]
MAKASRRLSFLTKEIVTIEELCWLFVGLGFGFLLGKGAGFMMLALPIAIFFVMALWYFERKSLY